LIGVGKNRATALTRRCEFDASEEDLLIRYDDNLLRYLCQLDIG
jgi:hypothetical protein